MKPKKLEYMGMKFSTFYKDLLAQAGYSQADMQVLTGISKVSSSRYYNDITIPSRQTAMRIIETVAKEHSGDKKSSLMKTWQFMKVVRTDGKHQLIHLYLPRHVLTFLCIYLVPILYCLF